MVAVQRSGHHAVAHWICAQWGDIEYINDPAADLEPMENRDNRTLGTPDKRLYTLEQIDLRGWAELYLGRFEWVMVCLRDPFNTFASGYRSTVPPHRLDQPFGNGCCKKHDWLKGWWCSASRVERWKQQAKEWLGEASYLKDENLILCNFNDWHTSWEYRKNLAATLGIPFTDAMREVVNPSAGGSSFDRRRFNGRASQMDLLGRWKQYRKHPRFKDLIDGETRRLSRQIFDFCPGLGR